MRIFDKLICFCLFFQTFRAFTKGACAHQNLTAGIADSWLHSEIK